MRPLALLAALVAAPAPAAPPVSAVAYSQSTRLAAGLPGEVKLFAPNGKPASTLGGQDGRVSALAFASDESLAVASGAPSVSGVVRIYDAEKTAPRDTFTAHKDSILALSWSPDGKTLATASYDRLVKLWDVKSVPAKLVQTLTDHSDSVYTVAFNGNGKLLATGGADRSIKVWDTATGKRLYTLSDPTDWVYSVAWQGDLLYAGGIDRSLRVWKATAAGGKLLASTVAHATPILGVYCSNTDTSVVTLAEDGTAKTWQDETLAAFGMSEKMPSPLAGAVGPHGSFRFAVGQYDGTLRELEYGKPKIRTLKTLLPAAANATAVKSGQDSVKVMTLPLLNLALTDAPASAEKPPTMVNGVIDRPGHADRFPVELKAGEQLGIELTLMPEASKFKPIIAVTDAMGRIVAEIEGLKLGFTAPTAGRYTVTVRDENFAGDAKFAYRLHLGPVPVVAGVSPLLIPAGQKTELQVVGVHLGEHTKVTVDPGSAKPGDKVIVPLPAKYGQFRVQIAPPDATIANGLLETPDAQKRVSFRAKKGERLAIEVVAARLGSPVDSLLTIEDAQGKPVPRVVLRSVSRVFTIFRDHSARGASIRLETWNELAVDDYLYTNGELMRVEELPGHPDADAKFYAVGGRRETYLGTTANDISTGSPLYKVEFHPPGSTFAPNGLPVVELPYRNDDELGADSLLLFDPPADGEYFAVVRDSRGNSGPTHAFGLMVRKPEPRFTLSFSPDKPKVFAGTAVPLTVTANRMDGFDKPIRIQFAATAGFSAPDTLIEAEQTQTVVPLTATVGAKSAKMRVTGVAQVGEQDQSSSAEFGPITTRPKAEISLTTDRPVVDIQPGQRVKLTVKVERAAGYKNRVLCEVRGLPHGVMVLNLGLNGVLIRPDETSREITIAAEPWVKPMRVPFTVTGKYEGKNADVAAPPVTLAVE